MTVTYLLLKYLHVIGAAVLLGTGAGIAFFMLMAHLTGKARVIASVGRIVVIADFGFTAAAVIAQPLTSIALAHYMGYSLIEAWIAWSIALYLLTGAFWLPVVWIMRLRDMAPRRSLHRVVRCHLRITGCSGGGLRSASRHFLRC
jgi:uncharacterized membrane protein